MMRAFVQVSLFIAASAVLVYPQEPKVIEKSAAGFQAQIDEVAAAVRAHDDARAESLSNRFLLPNPDAWFVAHLGPQGSAGMAERYQNSYAKYPEMLRNTLKDIVATHDARLQVRLGPQEGETPRVRPNDQSGVTSVAPTELYYFTFHIEIGAREISSWADLFAYDDGVFRVVGGGAWPIWAWKPAADRPGTGNSLFITRPVPISSPQPSYPLAARNAHLEGDVVLHITVDKQGAVKDVKVVSGDQVFLDAAIDAVRQWRYRPGRMGTMPIESAIDVKVQFRLEHP